MRECSSKNTKKNKGFTLIEVILAACILVVACIPLISSFVVSTNMNMRGRQKEQAMTVAENLVEGIKAVGPTTAKKWAQGNCNVTGYSVIPKNDADKTAMTANVDPASGYGVFGTTAVPVDLTNYVISGDSTTVNKIISVTPDNYKFKVNNIYMGNSYYDAVVTMTQDLSDADNAAAYAYKTQYDTINLNILKYYKVDVEVSNAGSTEIIAKYHGTVVSKD